MINSPTDRQMEVLSKIKELTDKDGYPPTMKELSTAMGCSENSKEGMASNVRALVSKELLKRKAKLPRSMVVTEAGLQCLSERSRLIRR